MSLARFNFPSLISLNGQNPFGGQFSRMLYVADDIPWSSFHSFHLLLSMLPSILMNWSLGIFATSS
jgi:hypothetical protein